MGHSAHSARQVSLVAPLDVPEGLFRVPNRRKEMDQYLNHHFALSVCIGLFAIKAIDLFWLITKGR